MADPEAAPSENPFAQFGPRVGADPLPQPDSTPESPPAGASAAVEQDNQPENPFAKFGPKPEADEASSSAAGAFARGAEKGVVPAATGLVGAGLGGGAVVAAGAALGTTVGPWGTLAGGIGGGLIAGYGGSYLQNWAISKLPDSWKDKLGVDDRQARLDEAQHGTASFLGGLVPYAVTMHPSVGTVASALPENATALQQIMAHPVTSRVFGGALSGGVEVAQDEVSQGHADWKKAAISTAFGMVFNRPNVLGEALTAAGERPVRALAGIPPPTVARVADLKVMGPGITEGVFRGTEEQAPNAAMTAQEDARAEQAALGEPPEPDLHAVARQMEPELFAKYDDLVQRRDAFQAWHGEGPAHEMAEKHLATTEADLQEIAPTVQAAYRRAQETVTEAPEEPEQFKSFAEMLAARENGTGRQPDAGQAQEAQPSGEPSVPAGGEAPPVVAGQEPTPAPVLSGPQRSIGDQRAFIADDVTKNLIAAGRPEEEARAAGQLVAARYVTRAGRFEGKLGSPEELYSREGAAIAGPGGAAIAPRQAVQQYEAAGAARPAPEPVTPEAASSTKPGIVANDFDTADKIKNEWRKASPFKETEPFVQASWHNQRALSQVGEDIASATGAEFKNPGIKARTAEDIATIKDENKRKLAEAGRRRLEAKGQKHGIGGVTDQVRSGFDVKTPEQADQAIQMLAEKYPVTDEGWQTTESGYFDRKAYVKFPDGMIGEVQFWPPGMFDAKERRGGHGLYEGVRELPPWHPLIPEFKKTTRELYGDVRAKLSPEWNAVLGSGGSEPNLLANAGGESSTVSPASAALTSDHLPLENTQASESVTKQGSPSSEPAFSFDMQGSPSENIGPHSAPVNAANYVSDHVNSLTSTQQRAELPKYSAAAEQAPKGVDQPAGVFMFNPTELNVDASRFQFKSGGDEYGVTGALRNVTKWDPAKAQAIIVWEANDGKLFVADGHQRAGLARRLTEQGKAKDIQLPGILYREKDGISADDIRAMAAVTNIANGSGSALDGAKVLRARPDLMDGSLPLSVGKGKQAAALARLGDEPFRMVVNDVVPENYGAVVGELIPNDPARQEAALKAIARFEPKNADEAAVLTQRVAQAELAKAEEGKQTSMFGDLETPESTAGEEMKIVGRAIGDLKKDKALFARVLANAERIEQTGSQIERGAAQGVTSDAEKFAKTLTSDAYTAGPIRTELIAAARDLKNGKASIGEATGRILAALRTQAETHGADRAGVVAGEPTREYAQNDQDLFEAGAEGKPQQLIPGVKPVTQRDLVQAAANKPLAPKVAQKAVGGLFGDSMDQKELFQTARGTITIAKNARPVIKMMKDANASTFVHESGHQFLEELMRDADHPEAPPGLRDDAQTVRDWLGVTDDIKTKHHEKFARGFEQYLREGVAPSPELGSVFAKFRNWLLSIYQSIKGLGAEISPDIRSVFDRMLEMEPQRTVVAPERPSPTMLHDIHEVEAAHAGVHDGEAVHDRIVAESNRYLADQPPENQNEIQAAVGRNQQVEVEGVPEQPAGEAGPGGGQAVPSGAGAQPLVEGRGGPGAEPGVGAGGTEHGAEQQGGTPSNSEGAGRVDPRSKLGDNAGTSLAPGPTDLFGSEPAYVDKAGNIRLDTLNTSDDVKKALRESAAANNDFIGDRRGVVTDGQVLELANEIGMSGAESLVADHIKGQAFNAEQVVALRKLLRDSAASVAATAKKFATSGSDEDILAFAQAKDRLQMVQKTVAGVTAEAGRALRAFRTLPGEQDTKALEQMIAEATGKTLFQLKEQAKIASTLDNSANMNKWLQNVDKPSVGGMVLEGWIMALLSGPSTQISNVLSNTIFAVQHYGIEKIVASGVGAVLHAVGREGTYTRLGEVGAAAKGMVQGAAPALLAAGESFKKGATGLLPGEEAPSSGILQGILHDDMLQRGTLDPSATFRDVQAAVFATSRGVRDAIIVGGALLKAGGVEGSPFMSTKYDVQGAIPDIQVKGVNVLPVGTAIRATGRFLATADTFAAGLNYSAGINAIAYRMASDEGLTGSAFAQRIAQLRNQPTPEMMADAAGQARQTTFMDKAGPFVKAINNLTAVKVNIPGIGETQLLKFVAPFTNVVSRILDQTIIKRTPVGALLSKEIQADLLGKNGNIAQETAAARMLIGSAILLGFGSLAAEGYVTGAGPSDPKENAIWRLTNQPHSMKIGNTFYQIQKLGPMGMLMSMAADLHDVRNHVDNEGWEHAAALLFKATIQNTLDQSSLQGPAEMMKAAEDPDRYGQQYIRTFLASFVPGDVNWIAKSRDPYMRQAWTAMDAIKARVPGYSETLHPKIDLWGNPVPSREQLGGMTGIYTQAVNADPVNKAMADLGMKTGPVEKKLRGVELTPDQYEFFARTAGRMTKMRLDTVVRSHQWDTFPTYQKTQLINEIVKQSRTSAEGLLFANKALDGTKILMQAHDDKMTLIKTGKKPVR